MKKKLKFAGIGRSLSPYDLSTFEKEVGISLPEAYKSFLLKNNGGIPNKIYFSVSDDEYVMGQFFPLDEDEINLKQSFQMFKVDQQLLPAKLLPIADDAFGNIICINLTDNAIELWDHEDGMVIHLSPSLDAFLDNLTDD